MTNKYINYLINKQKRKVKTKQRLYTTMQEKFETDRIKATGEKNNLEHSQKEPPMAEVEFFIKPTRSRQLFDYLR